MGDPQANNVVWHEGFLTTEDFERRNGHKGAVLWLTGLSGAGKSTIAHGVERLLFESGRQVKVLDGDNIRHGLNKDLGFSPAERHENIRRISEVTKLFRDDGTIVLAAFISPYRSDRDAVRSLLPRGTFFEIYVKCALEECMRRDPKGSYKKAVEGKILGYTGVSAPYEPPARPDLIIETEVLSPDEAALRILDFLHEHQVL